MKRFFSALLVISFVTSTLPSVSQKLEESFILSLQQNKFNLLQNHLPTVEFYKTLPEAKKRTEAEITRFIKESNERLKGNWQKIVDRMKSNAVDPLKVEVTEALIYDPFSAKNEMEGMVIVYKYNDRLWDDLTFIVTRWKNKTLLLEIPNPTKAFSFNDTTMRNRNEAKTMLELQDPAFKKQLEEQVKNIIASVKANDLDAFAQYLVYRGDDEARKWKSALNKTDSAERQQAGEFMNRVTRNIRDCSDYKTGEIKSEKESEGTWIVLPLQCGTKTVHFAFLKVNDKMLLGDIDAENN